MRLCAIKGLPDGTAYELTGEVFVIGREEGCNIILSNSGVSRRHCELRKAGAIWTVEDLKSLNGVYVNGLKAEGPTQIYNGDILRVHDVEFRVEGGDNRPEPPPAPIKRGASGAKIVAILILIAVIAVLAISYNKINSGNQPTTAEEVQGDGEQNLLEDADDLKNEDDNGSLLAEDDVNDLKAESQPVTDSAPAATPQQAQQEPVAPRPRRSQDAPAPIVIHSVPEGAEVFVDKKSCGKTPLVISGLANGKHTMELSMKGYEVYKAQLDMPEKNIRPYRLILKAGAVQINTDPAGAWVWESNQFKGVTPLIIEDMCDGEHELTIMGPGCELVREKVDVTSAKGNSLELNLKTNFGAIDVKSRPVGCKVFLNGVLLGKTSGYGEYSDPLPIWNVVAGQYVIRVEHPCGIYYNSPIVVKRGETVSFDARLWVPTHRLELKDGTSAVGMMIGKNDNGDIVLEMSNTRTESYAGDKIQNVVELTGDELMEQVEKFNNDRKQMVNSAVGQQEEKVWKAEEFIAGCENTNQQLFNTFIGKSFTIIGVPSVLMKENDSIVAMFGTKLKCAFVAGTPQADFDNISDSKEKNESIILQGTLYGRNTEFVMLTNCVLKVD